MTDELHKPIRKKFKTRRVFTSGVDGIWALNLVEMQSFSRSNKGFKYILMIVDVISKYGSAVPLKTKTGAEVTRAFQSLWHHTHLHHKNYRQIKARSSTIDQ